jgi:hypothetical protein
MVFLSQANYSKQETEVIVIQGKERVFTITPVGIMKESANKQAEKTDRSFEK